MGMLFSGPIGSGITFVAEAFAKECGLTTIKLKNFRSKWVGATEGNLEKILNVIKAIGQVWGGYCSASPDVVPKRRTLCRSSDYVGGMSGRSRDRSGALTR